MKVPCPLTWLPSKPTLLRHHYLSAIHRSEVEAKIFEQESFQLQGDNRQGFQQNQNQIRRDIKASHEDLLAIRISKGNKPTPQVRFCGLLSRLTTDNGTASGMSRIYRLTDLLPVWIELFNEADTNDAVGTNLLSLLSIDFFVVCPLNVVPLLGAFLL